MADVQMSAAERRRQKLLARAGKVEAGQTIGSQTIEEVKQDKKEVEANLQKIID